MAGSLVISKFWEPGSPSWKANKSRQPALGRSGSRRLGSRPTGPPAPREKAEAAPRLWPATGRAGPPGGTRHGQLPRLPGSSDRREGVRKPPSDYPASGTGAGNRTRGAGTRLPQVPEAVGSRTGLGRLERGPPTVRRVPFAFGVRAIWP